MDTLAHQAAFERIAADYHASRCDYPQAMLDWLGGQVSGPGPVVDIGCGPGTMLRPLARRFSRVVGLDFAMPMLREMRSAMELPAVQSAGERLPFRTGSISLAVCSQSLHWMHAETVLEEVRRVLGPEGRLLLCWQGWMAADTPAESLYQQGWRTVLHASPAREPNRPRMHEVADGLERSCVARFEAPHEVSYTAEQLARLFASRASVGRLDREARDALEHWWTDAARARLGEPIVYGFRVHGRLLRMA